MTALRLVWCFLTAAIYEALTWPLEALGLVAVPLATVAGSWQVSPINGTRVFTAPRWLWLWGNDEDGYMPRWYQYQHQAWGWFRTAFMWAAIRNPLGNLRFIRALHPPPDPARIRYVIRPRWFLCWQGAFMRFEYCGPEWWLGIGWKYAPSDCLGVSRDDWRRFGVGFGLRRDLARDQRADFESKKRIAEG